MQNLLNKKCIPCEGGTRPLTAEQIAEFLPQISKWEVLKNKEVRRTFLFNNFSEAMDFVNKVADLAEQEGHHPNIYVHDWNKVTIELSTHAIGGLSENDFILAAKIDTL
jgi:4a-hydroxytetrahydrobiopterin dehydratase